MNKQCKSQKENSKNYMTGQQQEDVTVQQREIRKRETLEIKTKVEETQKQRKTTENTGRKMEVKKEDTFLKIKSIWKDIEKCLWEKGKY